MTEARTANINGEELEIISIEGVAALLRQHGHPTARAVKGVSEEGDRWQAVITDTGETLVHTAKIGGKTVGHFLGNPITEVAG